MVAAVSDTDTRVAVAGYHLCPERVTDPHQSHLTARATAGGSPGISASGGHLVNLPFTSKATYSRLPKNMFGWLLTVSIG